MVGKSVSIGHENNCGGVTKTFVTWKFLLFSHNMMAGEINLFLAHEMSGFDKQSVERTNYLHNVTRKQLLEWYLDDLFKEYLLTKKNDDDEEMYLLLQQIFSKVSFSQAISDEEITFLEGYEIPDRPLFSHDIVEILGRMSAFLDVYFAGEVEKEYRMLINPNQSGLGYACYKRLSMMGAQVGVAVPKEGIEYTKIAYLLENFFGIFLANKFLQKTAKKIKEETDNYTLFLLEMELNSAVQILYTTFNLIADPKERNMYIQRVYNMTQTPGPHLTEDIANSFLNDFQIITESSNSSDAGDGQSERTIERVVGILKELFDKHFSSITGNEGGKPEVDIVTIGKTLTLLPKTNFYFDKDVELNDIMLDEGGEIKKIFGPLGYLDSNYRNKSIQQLIRDANIYGVLGEKIWRGDFNTDVDVSTLQGTYFVLNQQDGYLINDEEVVLDKEKIPDSDLIKERFSNVLEGFFSFLKDGEPIGDLTQPTLIISDYMRAKAKYKIQDGKIIPNTFL